MRLRRDAPAEGKSLVDDIAPGNGMSWRPRTVQQRRTDGLVDQMTEELQPKTERATGTCTITSGLRVDTSGLQVDRSTRPPPKRLR